MNLDVGLGTRGYGFQTKVLATCIVMGASPVTKIGKGRKIFLTVVVEVEDDVLVKDRKDKGNMERPAKLALQSDCFGREIKAKDAENHVWHDIAIATKNHSARK